MLCRSHENYRFVENCIEETPCIQSQDVQRYRGIKCFKSVFLNCAYPRRIRITISYSNGSVLQQNPKMVGNPSEI